MSKRLKTCPLSNNNNEDKALIENLKNKIRDKIKSEATAKKAAQLILELLETPAKSKK